MLSAFAHLLRQAANKIEPILDEEDEMFLREVAHQGNLPDITRPGVGVGLDSVDDRTDEQILRDFWTEPEQPQEQRAVLSLLDRLEGEFNEIKRDLSFEFDVFRHNARNNIDNLRVNIDVFFEEKIEEITETFTELSERVERTKNDIIDVINEDIAYIRDRQRFVEAEGVVNAIEEELQFQNDHVVIDIPQGQGILGGDNPLLETVPDPDNDEAEIVRERAVDDLVMNLVNAARLGHLLDADNSARKR